MIIHEYQYLTDLFFPERPAHRHRRSLESKSLIFHQRRHSVRVLQVNPATAASLEFFQALFFTPSFAFPPANRLVQSDLS